MPVASNLPIHPGAGCGTVGPARNFAGQPDQYGAKLRGALADPTDGQARRIARPYLKEQRRRVSADTEKCPVTVM